MRVSGEQWPLFLYADLAYDEQDPWNGLMRSEILVKVCALSLTCFVVLRLSPFRGINTSLPLQALLMKMSPKPRDQEMLVSTA